MIAAGFLLAFLGCLALSAAMRNHMLQIWRTEPEPVLRHVLRAAGALMLAASAAACIVAQGPAVGIVLWLGLFTAAAFVLVMLLCYFPPRGARSQARAAR